MNILFYNNFYPDPLVGGIERITSRLSESLRTRGYVVHCLYTHPSSNIGNNNLFIAENVLLSSKEVIRDYIIENSIDVFICQHVWENYHILSYIKETVGCKVIFVFHNIPCHEFLWINYRTNFMPLLLSVCSNPFSIKIELLKQLVRFPRIKRNWDNAKRVQYIDLYNSCDRFVVLSKSYIEIMKRRIFKIIEDRITAIPNMLSYEPISDIDFLQNKEHKVLVVSRMQEVQKRISRILRFWREIEKDKDFDNWDLEIVGEGPDLELYKQMSQKTLHRVSFYGKQEPRSFYEKSSIFLMTSAYEGWGITLTEAQQFGCVPIVMNTYSAAKDIITDRENGFLVDYEWQFVRRLKQLMRDSEMRTRMAVNAIETSHRFGKDRVTDMWIDLFNSL